MYCFQSLFLSFLGVETITQKSWCKFSERSLGFVSIKKQDSQIPRWLQLTSEVRAWLICNPAQGQTWFWALMRQILRAPLFLHHPPPLPFLLSIHCRVTGQDCAGAAEVVLGPSGPCDRCVWGSCCSSHPSWQPCLTILGGSPLVSRSYYWIQLLFPLVLMLSCDFQGFLSWSQSSIISMAHCRKVPSLCISLFAPPCLNPSASGLSLPEFLTVQWPWAALGMAVMLQTNSNEEQGEALCCMSSELKDCWGVTERQFYEEKLKRLRFVVKVKGALWVIWVLMRILK